jgi:MoaA/NifB/PqqE/SkfB family radical SAM enzyme
MNPFENDKVLAHIDYLAAYKHGRVLPPILVELDMTNACNHHCPGCTGGRCVSATLSLDEAQLILTECADYGVKAVTFAGGGEPLVNPATIEAAEHAAAAGLHVGIITNGSFLDTIAARRLLAVCEWVRVSLDADGPDMFARTHGANAAVYAQVIGNILQAARIKRSGGLSCTLGVGFLVGAATRGGMVEAARQFRGSGVDYIQFRPFHGSALDVSAELAQCRRYEQNGYRVVFSPSKFARPSARTYSRCHAAALIAVIQADGNMPFCCHLRECPDICPYLGNALMTPIWQIWESEGRRKILAEFSTDGCMPNCRADAHNRLIERIQAPREHPYFL